jgi:peptide-methionine (S)-S-oxide reductase
VNDDEERLLASAAKAQAEAELGKPDCHFDPPGEPLLSRRRLSPGLYRKNPVRYRFYRFTCGRDARLKRVWGS